MSEKEKIDMMAFMRLMKEEIKDEVNNLTNLVSATYSTKRELNDAKNNRDKWCMIKGKSNNMWFAGLLSVNFCILLFLAAVHGEVFLKYFPWVSI